MCNKAYIKDYIESLPNKYETLIGENGVNLSGGQKQRLAIARALLKNSKIFLFDEATSALDNISERYINIAINKLSSNHTIILSSFIDADKIIVVNNGNIVGQGSHKQLISTNKTYENLYKTAY